MKRLLRLIGTLLKPRNFLVIWRLFRSGRAEQAARAWQRGDSVSPWLPFAVPVLIWLYDRSYRQERQQMREARAQELRSEKQKFDQAERRLLREVIEGR